MKVSESRFRGKFPDYQQPTAVGYFSLDGERNFHANASQLKYIHTPPHGMWKVNFDLDQGIENVIKKDESANEKIDNLLRWILLNTNKLQCTTEDQKSIHTDFVCYRGLLTVLMCTPYERNDGWIVCATKWQGTTYLCGFETEEKRHSRETATDQLKKFMSWGFKFEQYMTKDNLNSLPDATNPVNEREEFNVTYRTRLNGLFILFGAEMDGIRSQVEIKDTSEISKAEFIELKTSRQIQTGKQNYTFTRYKLLRWWCQSFLVGIPSLICGFRDDSGIVHELQEFRVKEMPNMAQGRWDARVCMNFCASFLSFVKQTTREENPSTVWKYEWQPGFEEVKVVEIPGPSQFSFLPSWYIDRQSSSVVDC